MTALLPPWPQLFAFIVAVFILAISPGPAVFYIITRSLTGGRAHGLATVAGVTLGNLLACQLAAAGVAILFSRWPGALLALKTAGAAYLIFLGLQALLSRRGSQLPSDSTPRTKRRLFIDGFLVALLNPKTIIFMAAFLPQFLVRGGGWAQLAFLAVIGPFFAAFSDLGYALAAGWFGERMQAGTVDLGWTKWVSGVVFVGLGVWALWVGLG